MVEGFGAFDRLCGEPFGYRQKQDRLSWRKHGHGFWRHFDVVRRPTEGRCLSGRWILSYRQPPERDRSSGLCATFETTRLDGQWTIRRKLSGRRITRTVVPHARHTCGGQTPCSTRISARRERRPRYIN